LVGKNVTADSGVKTGSGEESVSAFAIAQLVAKEIRINPSNT
jgi:hypothetical protein